MSNQVRKRTWDSSDAQTNVWFFGDSIGATSKSYGKGCG